MKQSTFKMVSLILIIVLLQSCVSSKFIYSKNDPSRIPSKLKTKDKDKQIYVYNSDTLYESGQLLDFNDDEIHLYKKETEDTIAISTSQINKIFVKEEIPLWYYFGFIVVCYGI